MVINSDDIQLRKRTDFIVCCVGVIFAAMLFLGQMMAASHAHEDAHDEHPSHNFCEVCIVTINDDTDFEDIIDDGQVNKTNLIQYLLFDEQSIAVFVIGSKHYRLSKTIGPPDNPPNRQFTPRAPPVHI